MKITKLEISGKFKVRVFIDNEFAFPLYPKDILLYQLEDGSEISKELITRILEETVLHRAREKALSILKHMDRTEEEIKRKLKDFDFPEDIISSAIDYVKAYNYVNDERYAFNYIRYRKNSQSRLRIKTDLQRKGINNVIIDKILKDEYESNENEISSNTIDPEEIAIKKAIYKKIPDPEQLSYEEKQKLKASLYRKGFNIDKINKFL